MAHGESPDGNWPLSLPHSPIGLYLNPVTALLHQPFGCAGGSTDAYRFHSLKPLGLNLFGTLNEMTVGIHPQTLIEEHPAITALTAADEEHQVVTGGKGRHIGHAVGHPRRYAPGYSR